MNSESYQIPAIGYIKSSYPAPSDPFEMREKTSKLIIYDYYKEALFDLKIHDNVNVLFYFHLLDENKIQNIKIKTINYFGEEKGLFACCTPYRPSRIGLTEVKITEINDNVLTVSGLDAVDGSPILDIKPSYRKK